MRIGDLIATLTTCFSKGIGPLLIVGEPGCGKSDAVTQAAAAAGCEVIVSHPAVHDPTAYSMLPAADGKGGLTWHPFGSLKRVLTAVKRTVWFIDDLGQASEAVQKALMQCLLAREVDGLRIPDCVTIVCATNDKGQRAGVSGLLEPVKSRFVSIIRADVHVDDFLVWAHQRGAGPEWLGFFKFRPELLSQFKPTADLTNSPCPRTWAKVMFDIAPMPFGDDVRAELEDGAVGPGPAAEWRAFRSLYSRLTGEYDIQKMIDNPAKAPVPAGKDALGLTYAVISGMAYRINKDNAGNVLAYYDRLAPEMGVAGVQLVMLDSTKRTMLVQVPAFAKWCAAHKDLYL